MQMVFTSVTLWSQMIERELGAFLRDRFAAMETATAKPPESRTQRLLSAEFGLAVSDLVNWSTVLIDA